MSNLSDDLKAAKNRMMAFAKQAPEVMRSFAAVSAAASKPGHFSAADRELLAVSIAVATRCEDCILYHVDAAKRHGAQENALVEALEVAIEMGGGPAVMYAGKALEAYHAL
jgi:AhpD family alkylhydroperoxidase